MSIGATEPVAYSGMFGTAQTSGTDATGTTGTTGTATTGATTTTSTSADKDMFLKLLVAQMKYQDPMNPTDSSQFLAQSAQFTALEKMQAVADSTQQLLATQQAFGASSLVGRHVSWVASDGSTKSGTVAGVTFGTDGPTLDVGNGTTIPLSQIKSVTAGAAGATTT